jgi:hypothetical protein
MPDPPIMPRTACVMVTPSPVRTAIQHAGEALTTGNQLSDRPFLTDIWRNWFGIEYPVRSESGIELS